MLNMSFVRDKVTRWKVLITMESSPDTADFSVEYFHPIPSAWHYALMHERDRTHKSHMQCKCDRHTHIHTYIHTYICTCTCIITYVLSDKTAELDALH